MNSTVTLRRTLASRLRGIRLERFGEDETDLMTLANVLGLPPATWRNFENGVAMPAEILLKLIEVTDVNPHWLLTGKGARYTNSGFESKGWGEY